MGEYIDKTYVSSYSGANIEKAISFVFNRVAEPFNNPDRVENFKYEDFCVNNGVLYQCSNKNGAKCPAQGGTFNSYDWKEIKIFDNNGYVMVDAKNSTSNMPD